MDINSNLTAEEKAVEQKKIETELAKRLHIGNINPIRYRGYYFDVESSLYYLNTRYYDPQIGRFINADEITILDETQSQIHGLNLYMYCGDNPVMNVDPSGRFWDSIWGTLVAALSVIAMAASLVALTVLTGGVGTAALLAVASGFLIGGAVGGVSAAIKGTSIAGGIFGGAINGGAIGTAVGLGIITGGGSLGIAGGIGLFSAAAGINFAAGMMSYAATNKLNNKSINWKNAFIHGGLQSAAGICAFVAGIMSGKLGTYGAYDLEDMVGLKVVDFIFSFPGAFVSNILKRQFGG